MSFFKPDFDSTDVAVIGGSISGIASVTFLIHGVVPYLCSFYSLGRPWGTNNQHDRRGSKHKSGTYMSIKLDKNVCAEAT